MNESIMKKKIDESRIKDIILLLNFDTVKNFLFKRKSLYCQVMLGSFREMGWNGKGQDGIIWKRKRGNGKKAPFPMFG